MSTRITCTSVQMAEKFGLYAGTKRMSVQNTFNVIQPPMVQLAMTLSMSI